MLVRKLKEVLITSIKAFFKDECYLSALALTYSCLLSIVPVLAVALGMAKGFGLEIRLEEELLYFFPDQKEIVRRIVAFAYLTLEQVKGGVVAGVGALILFFLVFSLFWCMESALNRIWRVKKGRPFIRKISDYLAMMLLFPFLFIVASNLFFYLATPFTQAVGERWIYSFAYFLLIWTCFALLYFYIPNIRISFKYGLVSSFLAGTLFQLLQWLFLTFQIGVSQSHAIYGSFAAIPLFMLWLQASWLLVFLGAEFSFHMEQIFPLKIAPVQQSFSLTELGFFVAYKIVSTFADDAKAVSLFEIAQKEGISLEILKELADKLVTAKLLVSVKVDKARECYQPACPLEEITLKRVKDALEKPYDDLVSANPSSILNNISKKLALLNQEMELVKANQPLINMLAK